MPHMYPAHDYTPVVTPASLCLTVPPSIATLPLLVSVDLSQNKITSIPPHVLAACPRVHTLVLCYNQVITLASCHPHASTTPYSLKKVTQFCDISIFSTRLFSTHDGVSHSLSFS